jgi:hypothetical protein
MPILGAPSPELVFAATMAAALTLFARAASAAEEDDSLELRALAAQSTDHRHAQSLIGGVTGAVLIPTASSWRRARPTTSATRSARG